MNEYDKEKIILPAPAIEFVPHRPPMLLIDRLLERKEEKALVSAVLESGGLVQEVLVECLAQAAAAVSGYDARCAGTPVKQGMLVAVDSFDFSHRAIEHISPDRSTSVGITVMPGLVFGAVTIITGEIHTLADNVLLASGVLKVWEAQEMDDER